MGRKEQNLAKQAKRIGQPLPERVLNSPHLRKGLSIYLDAFLDLSTERNFEFGQSISWSKIIMYSEYNNFNSEQTEDLLFFIRKMDNEFIKKFGPKND